MMLGSGTRDARRTELYLDGLMAADERHALELPVDAEMDPAVRYAARELRAGLTRLHPSFRFEDALAARLSEGAARLRAGLPVDDTASVAMPGTLAQFRGRSTAAEPAAEPATQSRDIWLAPAFRRLPDRSTHPSRPLIVGGVGVAYGFVVGYDVTPGVGVAVTPGVGVGAGVAPGSGVEPVGGDDPAGT